MVSVGNAVSPAATHQGIRDLHSGLSIALSANNGKAKAAISLLTIERRKRKSNGSERGCGDRLPEENKCYQQESRRQYRA